MSGSIEGKARIGWGRIFAIALSVGVTAAFGLAAAYIIDWHAFVAAYATLSATKIILLCLLGLIPVLLRVMRLCVAIGRPLQWIFFRAVTLQGAAVATLPAKIGEAVLPLMLVRRAGYSITESVGILLLLRLYDLLTLMWMGAISLAFLSAEFGMADWRPLLWIGAAAIAAGMVLFPEFATFFSVQIRKYINPEGKIVRLVDELSLASRHLSRERLAGLILVSGLVWASLFLVFYLSGVFFEATPGVMGSVLAGVAGSLAFALPVNGLANVGPFEAAWAGAMLPLGVMVEAAVAAALLSHFVLIICNLTLAGVGALQWALSGSREPLI